MTIPILQFIQARGAGEAALRRFLRFAQLHELNTSDCFAASAKTLATELGLRPEVAENIHAAKSEAEKLYDSLQHQSVQIVWQGHQAYPKRLQRVLGVDAPPVIFLKGNAALLSKPSIGFCGSRKATEKGLQVTSDCATQLAVRKLTVVSGYANGVDFAAHRAALLSGGATVMVLAEGILQQVNKRELAELFNLENHLFVSEFPPRLPWSGRNAMKRNRTIIGLSDAMILVESGISGGTYEAGRETLKRNHPLFVVDFKETGPTTEGNPIFIQQGGIPLRSNRNGMPKIDGVVETSSLRLLDTTTTVYQDIPFGE